MVFLPTHGENVTEAVKMSPFNISFHGGEKVIEAVNMSTFKVQKTSQKH